MLPKAAAVPRKAMYNGRFLGDAERATMVVPPVAIPAPPAPVMARPMINAVGLGARPQMRLPSSNIATVSMKVDFVGKYVQTFPQNGLKAPRVRKYTAPYHETCSRPRSSSVILGTAVLTIVCVLSGVMSL
jgi:hypothetical protein